MTPRLYPGGADQPAPKPAAAPGLPTTAGHPGTAPAIPAPPPQTSRGPADRPLTPDTSPATLAPILLAAADQLRNAGCPDDALTTRDLVGAVIDGVMRAGSDLGAVADAQADACYALLAAELGLSPLVWADRPGSTRRAAVTAFTTAARKAGAA